MTSYSEHDRSVAQRSPGRRIAEIFHWSAHDVFTGHRERSYHASLRQSEELVLIRTDKHGNCNIPIDLPTLRESVKHLVREFANKESLGIRKLSIVEKVVDERIAMMDELD